MELIQNYTHTHAYTHAHTHTEFSHAQTTIFWGIESEKTWKVLVVFKN